MKLADYLTAKGLSPTEFAPKVGVSPEAIRLYLKGERHPRPKVMRAISAETEGAVSANDFFAAEAPAQ